MPEVAAVQPHNLQRIRSAVDQPLGHVFDGPHAWLHPAGYNGRDATHALSCIRFGSNYRISSASLSLKHASESSQQTISASRHLSQSRAGFRALTYST